MSFNNYSTDQVERAFVAAGRELQRRDSTVLDNDTRGGFGGHQSERDRAFTRYMRTGVVTPELVETRVSSGLTTAPTEAGQTDSANAGYQVPEGFWHNLQIALKAYGGIANDFRMVETDDGRPMPWPTNDPTGVTASVLGAELTQLSLSNRMSSVRACSAPGRSPPARSWHRFS